MRVVRLSKRSSFFQYLVPRHWVIGVQRFEPGWWFHLQGLKCPIQLNIATIEDQATTLFRKVLHQPPSDAAYVPDERRPRTHKHTHTHTYLIISRILFYRMCRNEVHELKEIIIHLILNKNFVPRLRRLPSYGCSQVRKLFLGHRVHKMKEIEWCRLFVCWNGPSVLRRPEPVGYSSIFLLDINN